MAYTSGGSQYLHVHQTNTLSTKLTAIILSIVAIVVLYIIIRVIISYQKDKQLAIEEKNRNENSSTAFSARKNRPQNNNCNILIALGFSNHMKIHLSLLFLLFTLFSLGQGEINGPAPVVDTMHTDFQGDWYLSGVTYYQSPEVNSPDLYQPVSSLHHIRITKDSLIFFSPPERFYKRKPDGYKYELMSHHPYHGSEIVTYLENKKNRLDVAKFTIKYNGKDLRLIESLQSKSYNEAGIESCSIYKPFVDSVHLEEKLLGTWESGRLFYRKNPSKNDERKLQLGDTIMLYRNPCKEDLQQMQLFFEFKNGSLVAEMTQSYHINNNTEENSSTNPSHGLVDGVYIKGHKSICSILPGTNIFIMKNENNQYTFSILSCTEDELKLVLLNYEERPQ